MPVGARDRFVDVLRVFAILAVVVQHWALPAMQFRDGQMIVGSALQSPGAQAVTWLSQIMPLFFFAGGAANVSSWRASAGTASSWLAVRLGRLSFPVLAVCALWIPLPYFLAMLGTPADPIAEATMWVARVLWFLPVYLLCVVLTPLLARLDGRRTVQVLVALVVAVAVVDVARMTIAEPIGYLNFLFVWLAVHQVGVLYANGQLRFLTPMRAAGCAVVAYALLAAMTFGGPYPVLMLGIPGAGPSNQAPPTLAILVLSAGLLALAFAVRPGLLRLSQKPRVRALVDAVSPRMMTIYLWHMTALMAGAGIVVVAMGFSTPAGLGLGWWLSLPVWIGLLAALAVPLIQVFGRLERIRMPRTPAAVGPVRVSVAAALIGAGLVGIMAGTYAPTPVPLIATASLTAGLVVLNRAGTAARVTPERHPHQPVSS